MGVTLGLDARHGILGAHDHDTNAILADFPTYTVFFVFTHGSPSQFGDCLANQTGNWPTHHLEVPQVSAAIAGKTQNQPPYNLVYFYACSVFAGNNTSMAAAFGINGQSIDRGGLGWPVDMSYGFANDTWCENVWARMCNNGDSLGDAVAWANANNGAFGGSGCWSSLFQNKVQPVLAGDIETKLHGVYGGVDADQRFK